MISNTDLYGLLVSKLVEYYVLAYYFPDIFAAVGIDPYFKCYAPDEWGGGTQTYFEFKGSEGCGGWQSYRPV